MTARQTVVRTPTPSTRTNTGVVTVSSELWLAFVGSVPRNWVASVIAIAAPRPVKRHHFPRENDRADLVVPTSARRTTVARATRRNESVEAGSFRDHQG